MICFGHIIRGKIIHPEDCRVTTHSCAEGLIKTAIKE